MRITPDRAAVLAEQGLCEIGLLAQDLVEAREENRQLREQQAAFVGGLDELSRWPEVPGLPYWHKDLNDNTKMYQIPPSEVRGILEAIRRRVREMLSFGRSAVDAYYEIDGLRGQLAKLEKEAGQ